jgi:outer membrane murein-binding lipoprotein Lpp
VALKKAKTISNTSHLGGTTKSGNMADFELQQLNSQVETLSAQLKEAKQ